MGVKRARYCVRARPKLGWQIWDRKMGKWWGKPSKDFPSAIIDKLNSGKRSEIGPY